MIMPSFHVIWSRATQVFAAYRGSQMHLAWLSTQHARAGQLHGFFNMAGVVESAAAAFKECVAALAKALDVPSANNSVLAAEA